MMQPDESLSVEAANRFNERFAYAREYFFALKPTE